MVEKSDVRGESNRGGEFALAKRAGEEFGVVGQGAIGKALVEPNLPVEIRVVVIGMLGVRRNPRVVKEVLLPSSNGGECGITVVAMKGRRGRGRQRPGRTRGRRAFSRRVGGRGAKRYRKRSVGTRGGAGRELLEPEGTPATAPLNVSLKGFGGGELHEASWTGEKFARGK